MSAGEEAVGGPAGHGVRSPDEESLRDLARDLAHEAEAAASALPSRLDLDPESAESGLAQLVLTLLEFIREVLEHQAVRRMESGGLSDEEVERLGLGLMRLSEKMEEMKDTFGLTDDDLRLSLGPLGRLR